MAKKPTEEAAAKSAEPKKAVTPKKKQPPQLISPLLCQQLIEGFCW